MTIQRMEHVGIVVDDLAAATAFLVELGLKLQGEGSVEGGWPATASAASVVVPGQDPRTTNACERRSARLLAGDCRGRAIFHPARAFKGCSPDVSVHLKRARLSGPRLSAARTSPCTVCGPSQRVAGVDARALRSGLADQVRDDVQAAAHVVGPTLPSTSKPFSPWNFRQTLSDAASNVPVALIFQPRLAICA